MDLTSPHKNRPQPQQRGPSTPKQTFPVKALVLVLLNRLTDGLDGAIARTTSKTDVGGYLDIMADFGFYLSVPIGFALATPGNVYAALILMASFTATGISFLAYAAIAAQRGDQTDVYGAKSLFYSSGLAEGSETILAFTLMCLFPHRFPLIAGIFAGMCCTTAFQRSVAAKRHFANRSQKRDSTHLIHASSLQQTQRPVEYQGLVSDVMSFGSREAGSRQLVDRPLPQRPEDRNDMIVDKMAWSDGLRFARFLNLRRLWTAGRTTFVR